MGCLEDMRAAGHSFATWYLQNYANADAGDSNAFRTFQKRVANVCGSLLRNLLLPAWGGPRMNPLFLSVKRKLSRKGAGKAGCSVG